MLKKLYIDNYRCLVDFTMELQCSASVALIGDNGTGKSTILSCLEILQKIGSGTREISGLFKGSDCFMERRSSPIKFEVDVVISDKFFKYYIEILHDVKFDKFKIVNEGLISEEREVFSRNSSAVSLENCHRPFSVDWHHACLPIIQTKQQDDPVEIFRNWLSHMIILAPVPALMNEDAKERNPFLQKDCNNFGDWLSTLLSEYPASYQGIAGTTQEFMHDFSEIRAVAPGNLVQRLSVMFSDAYKKSRSINSPSRNLEHEDRHSNPQNILDREFLINYKNMSDGEKTFLLCASIISASKLNKVSLVAWDNPYNYVEEKRIDNFIRTLLYSMKTSSKQIIITSHHEKNTHGAPPDKFIYLDRADHLDFTKILDATGIGSNTAP